MLDHSSIVSEKPSIIQFSYGIEKANSYVIVSNGHALVIDACSMDVAEELKKRGIIPDYLILTHEHCDHLWGVNATRSAFPEIKVLAQEYCSEAIGDPKLNKAKQYHIYATLRFGEGYQNEEAKNRKYTCAPTEITFNERLELRWCGYEIVFHHTPGHSPGSMFVRIKDIGIFSGDSILQEETFLKFDGGDEEAFNSVTLPMIESIPDETVIFPGHGEVFQMRALRENGRTTKE